MSARTCGCDPEANHVCDWHRTLSPPRTMAHIDDIADTAPIGTNPDPDRTGPTRATTFPNDAKGRKERPVASGVLDYFPDALVAVARVSFMGNEQHNPGQPLHWARGKSTDEADAMIRHFLQRGTYDDDGQPHSAKMVWRALALLQKELEQEGQ